MPAIKGQGTEEQKQKWLPLANKMQKIGCYAQTELGHGSNVQGLETTATFDPQTDQFILHSPTQTSSKVSKRKTKQIKIFLISCVLILSVIEIVVAWWFGKVFTHAVVYARLITNGKDHGVHGNHHEEFLVSFLVYLSLLIAKYFISLSGFIVQLRNLDDHSPLPGITIGDIGVKFGNGAYNSMDNGFLMFDKFCIPRDQMLMRSFSILLV